MTHAPNPSLLAWHLAVRRCSLTQQARHVLLTLAGHVDGSRSEALAWPSMDTLAAETGISRRKVQDAVRELERAGVVDLKRRSKGRASHLFRLRLASVPTRTNPAPRAGLEAAERAGRGPEPGTACQVTRQGVPGNPAPRAGQPGTTCRASNNHPSIDLAREHENGAPPASDGMDGPNKPTDPNRPQVKAKALRACGLRGRNVTKLAAEPTITHAMILDEWERITQAEEVRNRPAVLAATLAEHAGIELGSKRISVADLDPDALQARKEAEAGQARLEELRRRRSEDAAASN